MSMMCKAVDIQQRELCTTRKIQARRGDTAWSRYSHTVSKGLLFIIVVNRGVFVILDVIDCHAPLLAADQINCRRQ